MERLAERDARFTYEIVFSRDRGPVTPARQPGLVATFSDREKTVNVFARDVEALKLDPPRMKFRVRGPEIEKLDIFLRTGERQQFEFEELHSDFDFLTGATDQPLLMLVEQRASTERLPMRVIFGTGPEAVTYPWMGFSVVRGGSDEIELLGSNDIPFHLRVVINRAKASATVTIHHDFVGADVHAVEKLSQASKALNETHKLELHDLRHDKMLLRFNVPSFHEFDADAPALLHDLVAISDRFGVDLRFPTVITDTDHSSFRTLKGLLSGRIRTSDDFTVRLRTTTEAGDHIRQMLLKENTIRLEYQNFEPKPVLFDVPIPTGPVRVEFDRAVIKNAEEVHHALSLLSDGSEIELAFTPIAPGTIFLIGDRIEGSNLFVKHGGLNG